MTVRPLVRAALVAFILLTVMALGPGGLTSSSHAASPEELCELIPQDQGYSFSIGDTYCEAHRGDCELYSNERETCISVVVVRFVTAEEARADMAAWTPISGLGELAGEDDMFLSAGLYLLQFQRGEVVVGLGAALPQIDAARALAEQIDRELAIYLDSGDTTPDATATSTRPDDSPAITATAAPGDRPGAATTPAGPTSIEDLAESIMVNAFVEDATLFEDAFKPFLDAVGKRSGCSIDTTRSPLHWFSGLETGPDRCRATLARATQAAARLTEDARSDQGIDAGDLLQLPPGGVRAEAETVLAIWLANLEDADGQPLFPGVAASERVIYTLGRGGMVGGAQTVRAQTALTRYLALTIGRDLLAWETS